MAPSEKSDKRAAAAAGPDVGLDPIVEPMHWGYAIRDGAPEGGLDAAMAIFGRFVGTILLFAALGLWVMPDSFYGAEIFGMKLAAMVMFTIFGGYLYWVGHNSGHLEFHIDTLLGEVRIGRRGVRGQFQTRSRLAFDDISSAYLLRSKDRSQPARLFLRLAGDDNALEVAAGPEPALDVLRTRLAGDLAHDRKVVRPTRVRRASADLMPA